MQIFSHCPAIPFFTFWLFVVYVAWTFVNNCHDHSSLVWTWQLLKTFRGVFPLIRCYSSYLSTTILYAMSGCLIWMKIIFPPFFLGVVAPWRWWLSGWGIKEEEFYSCCLSRRYGGVKLIDLNTSQPMVHLPLEISRGIYPCFFDFPTHIMFGIRLPWHWRCVNWA